jgi:hypothetical protein
LPRSPANHKEIEGRQPRARRRTTDIAKTPARQRRKKTSPIRRLCGIPAVLSDSAFHKPVVNFFVSSNLVIAKRGHWSHTHTQFCSLELFVGDGNSRRHLEWQLHANGAGKLIIL